MTVDILDEEGRQRLAARAATRALLAFDFDGVLAPLVERRSQARVPARTRRLLAAVAERYPTIVLSGRMYADLEPRLRGIPLSGIYGNFGYESARGGEAPSSRVERWASRLAADLRQHQGVSIENKRYSLAVHYRGARDRAAAKRAMAAAIGRLYGARVLEGTLAATVLPGRRMHKGVALQRARRSLGCTNALYIGDDGTDEDAFASAPASRLVAIKVGHSSRTHAQFHLARQAQIDDLLSLLIELRSAVSDARRVG